MKSLATKADLAEFKAEIMEYVQSAIQTAIQSAIRAQTEEFRASFDRLSEALEKQSEDIRNHSDEIRDLREKDSRIKGSVDTLKYALPFLISHHCGSGSGLKIIIGNCIKRESSLIA